MSLLESIDGPRDLDALRAMGDLSSELEPELERESGRWGAVRVGVARTGEGSTA
ncbi:hypothetical protein ACTWQF_06945 [Streptomyces sp. 8N114]|uniref:hypothetical protein n=1 Tax=Streptomyces sp. 8N114 TaxID=3457419 RepID=UPI003FD2278C